MNLYFRFIILLCKIWWAPKIKLLEDSILHFRALPTDCDINLHITNSRYLSFMDLGRTYLTGQVNLFRSLLKKRWQPVVQAVELTYLKPIMIGQRFTLATRLIYWDEKYFYMEQRFLVHGRLYAHATVKGLFLHKQSKVPTTEVISLIDTNHSVPPMPSFVHNWKKLTEDKKNSLS